MKTMMDLERNQLDFDTVSSDCPWRSDKGKCRPTLYSYTEKETRDCEQKLCALMHFKKFFAGRNI